MAYKKITKRKLKTRYSKRKPKNDGKFNKTLRIVKYLIIGFFVSTFTLIFGLYLIYLNDLPSVQELEQYEFAESSTIYDRNGKQLYKIFKEKRTYVPFEEINSNMINAIVAGEDKRFWTNQGVDLIGLTRAGVYFLLGKNDSIKGTSTLTQQLIRNTIIRNRSSSESINQKIERKVKEFYLSYNLTRKVSKEKILELYLNKISYGHNAYGIEEAAKTFFDKKAEDLGILESSILASLPKGPTYYSPYNHPDRVVGYLYFFPKEDNKNITKIISQKDTALNNEAVNKFKEIITNLKAKRLEGTNKQVLCGVSNDFLKRKYNIDNDGCLVIEYSDLLNFLNHIQITDGENLIEYQTGRKDFILGRMLEDGYIDFEDYKRSVNNSIGLLFSKSKENIKAPHFVFYIKEYLEEKYGKDIISVGGLEIYTTLDLDKQEKAEEIVKKYTENNKTKFNAKNAASITIDNENGDIITMVGGVDYFDEENGGKVNMLTSSLQPGSTFKPFVYAMGIYNEKIGSKTPIYDVETEFPGSYSPGNFDGKFIGKMDISTALNNSRNIPAIKMIYLAGGESAVVSFMKKLGVNSLKNHGQYGAPLALGTGEMTAMELAGAYSVFANMGEKVEINPILKIVDTKGNIIEEKTEVKKEEVISKGQAYIMNKILSDTTTRPTFWNNYLTIGDNIPVAAKTGTSTKQEKKGGEDIIYPRYLWTAGYTKKYTTVSRAGNTNGKELWFKGNGLEGAGPIWRDTMKIAHSGENPGDWKKPSEVKEINVSEITGLLPNPEGYNNNFIVKSLFLNKPEKYDNSYRTIRVDSLCNGVVTDSTPEAAIREKVLLEFHSLYPNNPKWENPVQEWARSSAAKEKYGYISNAVTSFSNKECERAGVAGNITIKSNLEKSGEYHIGQNYIEIAYRSSNSINKVEIIINGILQKEIPFDNKKEGVYAGDFFIPAIYRNKTVNIEIRAVDNYYYSNSETKKIKIISKDTEAPEIKMINPIDSSIKVYDVDFFNLRAEINDKSVIDKVNIYINGGLYKTFGDKRRLELPINKDLKLDLGRHTLTIEAIDSKGNTSKEEIRIQVLKR